LPKLPIRKKIFTHLANGGVPVGRLFVEVGIQILKLKTV